jgi:hypothetical protein
MYYICVDPGKMTGLALIQKENKEEPVLLEATELAQFPACDWVEEKMLEHPHSKVICEDFIISERTARMSTKDTRFSLEIIGFIRILCKRSKIPLVLQTPANMKSFFGDWSLHDFGMWSKGGEGHKRDATRHGVYYMLTSGVWNPPMEHKADKGDYWILRKNHAID